MSIPLFVDGETDLDATNLNRLVNAANYAGAGIYNVMDYGATGDGVTDDLAAIQAAVDAVVASGANGVVRLPIPSAFYSISGTLVLREKVVLEGGEFVYGTNSKCRLHCTSTTVPAIQFGMKATDPGATYKGQIKLRNLQITGGLHGIACYYGVDRVDLDGVQITNTTTNGAAVYIEYWAEKWNITFCSFVAGSASYAWWHNYVGAASCYFDKMNFRNVEVAGGINCMRFDVWVADQIVFTNVHFTYSRSHGIYWDGGANAVVFEACTFESVGQDSEKNRTTGSITAASPTLTVADATGLAIGQPIVVQGAGQAGSDLFSTISNVVGTTITLDDNAVVSVTSLNVTNASADNIHFANARFAATNVCFVGCWLSGETADAGQRYSVYADGSFGFVFVGCMTGENHPIYDPDETNCVIGGLAYVRTPLQETGRNLRGATLGSSVYGLNAPRRNIISSSAGGDLMLLARDSNDAATGTFGVIEARKNNPNRDQLWYIDPTTNYVVQARADGGQTIEGALDHNGTTAGFYGTAPVAKQTGVAVSAAGIHAALVALGLISA